MGVWRWARLRCRPLDPSRVLVPTGRMTTFEHPHLSGVQRLEFDKIACKSSVLYVLHSSVILAMLSHPHWVPYSSRSYIL